ncbi:MAG: DUF2752 domain-containing protein [Lachnospiraceae bacterium]|nr:DUF2752 domain-containing protein [Lachnospiraceae bacterium]
MLLITGLLILAAYILGIGCPIKYMTGVSCPGCGMTRAVIECFHFNFRSAFYYHPLFFTLPVIIIVLLLWKRIPVRIRNAVMIIFIVAYLSVYVIRLFYVKDSVVTMEPGRGFVARIIKQIINELK